MIIKKIKIKIPLILGLMFFLQNEILTRENGLTLKIILTTTIFLLIYILTQKNENERLLFILLAIIGLFTLITSTNLFTIFLGLELQAFVGYTLVREKKSFLSTEAALKYFIIGSIASSIFILGTALVYGELGVIEYQNILDLNEKNNILKLAFTLILISLFFKIGAAPFHLWVPDVYSGTSYETLMFITIFPKIFLFILIKTLQKIFIINNLTIVIIIISLIIGSIQAVKQQKIKKFISYTIIYNNGFFLSLTLITNFHSDYIQFLSLFFYLISSFLLLLLFNNFQSLNINFTFQNLRVL